MNGILYQGEIFFPSKVVCVGRNYVEHIRELNNEVPGEPVLFIKPNSAIADELILPELPCRFEGELSFLIKKGQLSAVAFGLDLTLGELQNQLKAKGLPWERAKAFDGSALFSEFRPVVPADLPELRLELWLNGLLQQQGVPEQMIYPPFVLLEAIRRCFTLEDNDVVMTGTPSGVKELIQGDRLRGLIFLRNKLLIEREWLVQ